MLKLLNLSLFLTKNFDINCKKYYVLLSKNICINRCSSKILNKKGTTMNKFTLLIVSDPARAIKDSHHKELGKSPPAT